MSGATWRIRNLKAFRSLFLCSPLVCSRTNKTLELKVNYCRILTGEKPCLHTGELSSIWSHGWLSVRSGQELHVELLSRGCILLLVFGVCLFFKPSENCIIYKKMY